ncbi:alpha/beta hydrolase [Streptomyces sannanensis]|uniref:Alpha/beta hydrolase n=1 Tax=Streptomyces sannanensis TaxID=285536 RepID=A0ABP6SF03_9ACTN
MSKPRALALPPGTRAYRLRTARQEFAALDARPQDAALGTVLLVPGYTGSKEDFLALLEPLAVAGYRAVAVDGRGQYESPGPRHRAGYTQRELAQDVLAQAAALGDGPVHLLGHSFGGLVARAAVRLDPSPFRTLTLLSSGPGRVAAPQRARLLALRAALPVMRKEWVWAAMRWLDSRGDAAAESNDPADVLEFLERRWLGTESMQLRATGRCLRREPDRTAAVAALPVPLHIAYGDLETVWPSAELSAMALGTGAHHTVIEGAEHSPNVSHPEVLTAALVEFWAKGALDG